MDIRLKRTPGIYLVGFMGCGKTTVGKVLARRLGWPFADLDDDIETREGVSISEIFAARGEEEFRRIESEAIRARVCAVESGHPLVAALGGGAYTREENRELLGANGITVWLDCPFETVARRVAEATHRPLARDPERFAALYRERAEAYSRADFRIEISDDNPEKVAELILELPLFR